MTNRDKINAMSNKELAEILVQEVVFADYNEEHEKQFEFIKTGEVCSYETVEDALRACIAWLESEVEECS